MSYRDSPNYKEAIRRIDLHHKAKTDLGRHWHHREMMTALKALLNEKRSVPAGESSDEGESIRPTG